MKSSFKETQVPLGAHVLAVGQHPDWQSSFTKHRSLTYFRGARYLSHKS